MKHPNEHMHAKLLIRDTLILPELKVEDSR